MTLLGFALVFTAAICHATWNFFVKKINGGAELVWLFSALIVIIYLPLALWVVVVDGISFGPLQYLFIAISTIVHLAYFLLLQRGYRYGDLSVVYPVARSTGPLLSSFFAVMLLGEHVTVQLVVGAVIIIFGVLNLTGGLRRAMAANETSSLTFGLAVGCLIGTYTICDAYAVSVLLIPPLLLDYASSVGRVIVLAPVARQKWDLVAAHWRDHRFGVLVIAVLSPLAYILVLYAMTFTPVVYVAPTREISVLMTVLAGSLLLGEGQLARRLGWAVVIVAGVILLATA